LRQNIKNSLIEHLDYQDNQHKEWIVQTGCAQWCVDDSPDCGLVQIVSTEFSTENGFDFLYIQNITYTGIKEWVENYAVFCFFFRTYWSEELSSLVVFLVDNFRKFPKKNRKT